MDSTLKTTANYRSLYSRQNRFSLLEQIVIGYEKWMFYVNLKRRPQRSSKSKTTQPTSKSNLHVKKSDVSLVEF